MSKGSPSSGHVLSRRAELAWVSAACLILAALFLAFPAIDLAASGLFYRDGDWIFDKNALWLYLPYRGGALLGPVVVVVLLLLLLLSFVRRFHGLRLRRITLAFCLAAALVGPGLVVDQVLKNHLGRARPGQTVEFGGSQRFTPAFVPSDQCARNCSFVSGHVAGAAFVMVCGWLGAPAVRRRWLAVSVLAAGLMGFVRLAMGGHYLSDVVFAWFAVYFGLWLTEWGFRRLGWLPLAPFPNR